MLLCFVSKVSIHVQNNKGVRHNKSDWNTSCRLVSVFDNIRRKCYILWTDEVHTPMNDTRSRGVSRKRRHG